MHLLRMLQLWRRWMVIDKGHRFKIKENGDGIVTTDLYYNLYIMDTNELVETKIIS